jgi:hypothetical protein
MNLGTILYVGTLVCYAAALVVFFMICFGFMPVNSFVWGMALVTIALFLNNVKVPVTYK